MGFFERWFSPQPRPESAPAPRRDEIPHAIQEREEMLAGYLAALERLEAEEQGVRLEDYDLRLQSEDHRKMDELRKDQELRAAVINYRDRIQEQRKVA